LTGDGVSASDLLAAEWFSKSAEQGNHDAQGNLASLYTVGRGVPLDLNRAYEWRLLSLDANKSNQDDRLLTIASQMSSENIAAAENRASEWRTAHKTAPAELRISQVQLP